MIHIVFCSEAIGGKMKVHEPVLKKAELLAEGQAQKTTFWSTPGRNLWQVSHVKEALRDVNLVFGTWAP